MPDAAAETAAAASENKPPPAVNPDRVGEELADDARIWHVYDRVAKEDDDRRTKAWDNGLNNLALFAGLFSAVTTAFIIEARQELEPDYAQMTFFVLNATAFGEKPVHQPFVVPSRARTVNCLWITSLVLSLSAALIAIMGKDWIGMYTARPVCNLRQWAEMRTYRLLCVERWYMSGVIAAAPVLLHVSLLLFGTGLVLFISSDPVTHNTTLGLSLAAGVLYLVTTFSAVIFSTSPFKSPATQMIRTALSGLFSYLLSIIYRPKRNLVRTLLCDLHTMVVPRADDTALLPGGSPDTQQLHARRQPEVFLRTASSATVVYARKMPAAATAFVQFMLALLHSLRRELRWSRVRQRIHTIVSAVRCIPASDWFYSSAWTDLPTDRRPHLLAEALSWLDGASQAPDVFRALVFALGDLDVGPQVGRHTSPALRTRLRTEIRRTWQQIDFLTLARYVLADRNTPGQPVLDHYQFTERFDLRKNSELRCEDGLAAVIRVSADPYHILPADIAYYSPDQVAQPRMRQLLLPLVQKPQPFLTDALILLSYRYRTYCSTTNAFESKNLEEHVYQTLDAATRNAYAAAVTVKYGGTVGAIELLTFLCCHDIIRDTAKRAAVELIMEIRFHHPIREHRCLAFLLGDNQLWSGALKDNNWSYNPVYSLAQSLEASCLHPFEPTSLRTLSDDWEFYLALVRTAVMLFSPQNSESGPRAQWIQFLVGHLRQPPPSFPGYNGNLDAVRLILESAALIVIVGLPRPLGYHDDVIQSRIAILATIISDLGLRLRDPTTSHDAEQLFGALAFSEVKESNGNTRTWDLGEWLRTRAPEILMRSPSSIGTIQDVHDALSALYPLCEGNSELRAHWDRIGYPGRPGDILSCPFFDLGEFFANAEDMRSGVMIRIQQYVLLERLRRMNGTTVSDSSDDEHESPDSDWLHWYQPEH